MMKIWPFIRLMRPLNLAVVAFTMFAMRYWVIETLIAPFDFKLQLPFFDFCLLVFSVVCIAAAGNVINDYFDTRTDTINRPEAVIVGFAVPRRKAMLAHFVLSSIGILIGGYVSYRVGRINLVAIHIFCSASLWYYSTVFKKQLLLGNFLIALLAALVPVIVGLFEIPILSIVYSGEIIERFQGNVQPEIYFKIIFFWVLGFAAFAFLLNLLREMQKDLADMQGDLEVRRDTLPLVMGVRFTRLTITFLGLLTIFLVGWAYFKYIDHPFSLAYFLLLLVLPLLLAVILTWTSKTRKGYVLAGNITKGVMIAGVFYSFFIQRVLEEYAGKI